MWKAVIFDMDGVLVDSEPENLKLLKDYFKLHGKHASDEFLASLVGRSNRDTWPAVLEAWGEAIGYDEFHQQFHEYEEQHPFNYHDIVFDGVYEFLVWLKEINMPLALASSSPMVKIHKAMKECGFQEFFPIITSGEMFEKSKPDPAIYHKSAQLLGFEGKDCLVIEDSKFGIEAALSAGMEVAVKIDHRFGVNPDEGTYKFQTYEELRKMMEAVLK